MEFTPGDSLAILPTNDPILVESVLKHMGFSGNEEVPNPKGGAYTIRQALTETYAISEFDGKLLKAIAEKTGAGASELAALATPERRPDLEKFQWGRDVLDVLMENPDAKFEPAEFVSVLRKLIVRLYSISGSLRASPDEVHLTVATVRFESRGRTRGGVCTTFLADRVNTSTPLPTFIKAGTGFRLPAPEEDTPIIMVGPGTGIAPFRSFLQERRAAGAKGKAWLFFGEINRATCYFYEDEWNGYLADGTLHRLDTAFSRDQAQKLYVQHKLLEQSRDIYDLLEHGAIFYVCGDAARMAVDVDNALREIVAREGGKSPDEVNAYMESFKAAKRYRRDVY
jgi:sulfite reductase (NADPH) flavoprotein alpha-component